MRPPGGSPPSRRAPVRGGRRRRVREQQRRERLDRAAGPEGHVLPGGAGLVQRRRRHGQPLQPGQPGRGRRERPPPLLLRGLGRARRHLHLGRLGGRPGARHGRGPASTRPPTRSGRRSRPGRTRRASCRTGPTSTPPSRTARCSCPTRRPAPSSTARSTSCGASSASRWCPGRAAARPSRSRSRSSPRRDGGPRRARRRAGPRRRWPQASTSTRRMARAFTMRIDVRRFHIFIFQWRRRRRLTAPLALTGSWRWTGR